MSNRQRSTQIRAEPGLLPTKPHTSRTRAAQKPHTSRQPAGNRQPRSSTASLHACSSHHSMQQHEPHPPLIQQTHSSLHPSAAGSSASAPTSTPSRYALYRARKRRGEPIALQRSPEQFAALAVMPAQQRSSLEKKALRNQRYRAQSKQTGLNSSISASSAKEGSKMTDASLSNSADLAASHAVSAAASPASASLPNHSLEPSAILLAQSNISAFPAEPSRITDDRLDTDAAHSPVAAPPPHPPPLLMLSATRFAATLKNKQQRCLPFTFDSAHRSALQAAVERRVHLASSDSGNRSSSSRDASVGASASACPAASSADVAQPLLRLCDSDIELLQSCLTMLQRWPCWMQQQWLAVSSRKIPKSEVCCLRALSIFTCHETRLLIASAAVCVALCCTFCWQISQLHEQAALYDFVRDVALRHHPPIGYAVWQPRQLCHRCIAIAKMHVE